MGGMIQQRYSMMYRRERERRRRKRVMEEMNIENKDIH